MLVSLRKANLTGHGGERRAPEAGASAAPIGKLRLDRRDCDRIFKHDLFFMAHQAATGLFSNNNSRLARQRTQAQARITLYRRSKFIDCQSTKCLSFFHIPNRERLCT